MPVQFSVAGAVLHLSHTRALLLISAAAACQRSPSRSCARQFCCSPLRCLSLPPDNKLDLLLLLTERRGNNINGWHPAKRRRRPYTVQVLYGDLVSVATKPPMLLLLALMSSSSLLRLLPAFAPVRGAEREQQCTNSFQSSSQVTEEERGKSLKTVGGGIR